MTFRKHFCFFFNKSCLYVLLILFSCAFAFAFFLGGCFWLLCAAVTVLCDTSKEVHVGLRGEVTGMPLFWNFHIYC